MAGNSIYQFLLFKSQIPGYLYKFYNNALRCIFMLRQIQGLSCEQLLQGEKNYFYWLV